MYYILLPKTVSKCYAGKYLLFISITVPNTKMYCVVKIRILFNVKTGGV